VKRGELAKAGGLFEPRGGTSALLRSSFSILLSLYLLTLSVSLLKLSHPPPPHFSLPFFFVSPSLPPNHSSLSSKGCGCELWGVEFLSLPRTESSCVSGVGLAGLIGWAVSG
jgi:hypothetical protein